MVEWYMGIWEAKNNKVALFAAHAQEKVASLARDKSRGMSHNSQWSEDSHTH